MKSTKNVVIKHSIIPELVSGSSTQAVTQQQALKTLKKFQGLSNFTTACGFSHKAYRLGVSPTGAASKLWDTCHKNGDLSGSHPTYKNCSGFTLIELLVVVLIIGILAAVAVPQYQLAVEKARTTEALTTINALVKAEKVYQLANDKPTTIFSNLDIDLPTNTTSNFNFRLELEDNTPEGFKVWARRKHNGIERNKYEIYSSAYMKTNFCVAYTQEAQIICKHLCNTNTLQKDGSQWKCQMK